MKQNKKVTAKSGADKSAVTLVSRVINTAIKAADAAAAKKSHAIAFGLAYLMHFLKLTLDEATTQVLDEMKAKFPKTSRSNVKSFNHLLPVALGFLTESKAKGPSRLDWQTKTGLAIPKDSEWPSSQKARDILLLNGLEPMQAVGKSFALLQQKAEKQAKEVFRKASIDSGGTATEAKNPSDGAIEETLKKVATKTRSDAKAAKQGKEEKAAEKQVTDSAAFAESYILAHRGEWSSEVKAGLSALLSD